MHIRHRVSLLFNINVLHLYIYFGEHGATVSHFCQSRAQCTLRRWLRDNEANELNISSLLPICKSFETFPTQLSFTAARDNCQFSHISSHCLSFRAQYPKSYILVRVCVCVCVRVRMGESANIFDGVRNAWNCTIFH